MSDQPEPPTAGEQQEHSYDRLLHWLVTAPAQIRLAYGIETEQGLRPFHLQILAALRERPGMTASSLASDLVLAAGTVRRAVAELEEQGLLKRSYSASQGRVTLWHATANGGRIVDELVTHLAEIRLSPNRPWR